MPLFVGNIVLRLRRDPEDIRIDTIHSCVLADVCESEDVFRDKLVDQGRIGHAEADGWQIAILKTTAAPNGLLDSIKAINPIVGDRKSD